MFHVLSPKTGLHIYYIYDSNCDVQSLYNNITIFNNIQKTLEI